jgi:hypothetical protein
MLPAAIAHPLYQPARLLCLHLFLHIHLPASFGSLCSPRPVLPSRPGYPSPMSPDVSTLLICSSHLSGRSSSLPLPPVPSAGFLPRSVQVLAKSSPLPISSPLSSHIHCSVYSLHFFMYSRPALPRLHLLAMSYTTSAPVPFIKPLRNQFLTRQSYQPPFPARAPALAAAAFIQTSQQS